MDETRPGAGKVVVNRSMTVDGFIAGPGGDMDRILRYQGEFAFPEVIAATGAMLIGRATYDVSRRMAVEDTAYDGGPVFVLTHRPPDTPDPGVTFLDGPLDEAVARARAAAGTQNLEILGADLASQCLQHGLVTRCWCTCCPSCSATACASRRPAWDRSSWNRSARRNRAR